MNCYILGAKETVQGAKLIVTEHNRSFFLKGTKNGDCNNLFICFYSYFKLAYTKNDVWQWLWYTANVALIDYFLNTAVWDGIHTLTASTISPSFEGKKQPTTHAFTWLYSLSKTAKPKFSFERNTFDTLGQDHPQAVFDVPVVCLPEAPC